MSPESKKRRRGEGSSEPRALPRVREARPYHRAAGEATLSSLAWSLYQGRWTVLGVAAGVLLLAVIYLVAATPTFVADSIIQIEDRTKSVSGLEDLSALFGERTPAETEMEIMRSRKILGAAVEQLNLEIVARPRLLPVLGGVAFRRHRGPQLAWSPPFLGRFAWGGEVIRVTRLSVPRDLTDVDLTLRALGDGRFEIIGPDGVLIPDGVVGKPAAATVGGATVEIFVQDLASHPGTEFLVKRLHREDVVDKLQEDLRISEKGTRRTGIVVLSLSGPDPKLLADVLNALASNYQRQNVEQRSAEAEKTLAFLETQLPVLRRNAESAESALNTFRQSAGTVDLTRETQGTLERIVEVEKGLSELEMQRSELRQRFTGDHPALASVNEKAAQLRGVLASLQSRLRTLPDTEADSARLLRDAKVSQELYSLLRNKSQELRIVKSGTVGNVRIIDTAQVPLRPVSPKKTMVIVIALLLGLGLGVAVVLTRVALEEGMEDPDEIEAGSGVPVFVAVPHSSKQAAITRAARRHPGQRLPLLSFVDTGDPAVETLRILRTSLQVALASSRNNVIAIGGPSPGVGKSFICANLADVLAAAGQRILLVDGDLRRGTIHRYFGLERGPGLAELLTGEAGSSPPIRSTGIVGVDVVTTGRPPRNPSELLVGAGLRAFIEAMSHRYDLVIIDTPPMLAVTDAAILGCQAGLNLVVLKAGKHPLGEVSLTVKRYEQGGVEVSGFVLNDVQAVGGRYGRDGQYQRYEYRSVTVE